MKKLQIQYNSEKIGYKDPLPGVMLTPVIGEDYWLIKIPVGYGQAIVCFPKFGTIGIGFQKEEDWNTNLPYVASIFEIWDHIKRNKGNKKIKDEDCINAIKLIKEQIRKTGLGDAPDFHSIEGKERYGLQVYEEREFREKELNKKYKKYLSILELDEKMLDVR